MFKLLSDEFYLAFVAPSGECLRGKGPPWRRLFLAASGLNVVVTAILRDSLCVVSLLPCVQTVVCCVPCERL